MNITEKLSIKIGSILMPCLIISPVLATNTLGYLTKTTSFSKKDESSPTGLWETNIEYPEISGNTSSIKKINAAILQKATEFQCHDQIGDKQFNSEVTLINDKTVNLKFSDSWYCPGMPHPQGRTGAITYNLNTGQKIELNNEIKHGMSKELNQKLNEGLTHALKMKHVDEACPTGLDYFYSTQTDVVFVNKSDGEEIIQCEVEFKVSNDEIKKYLKDNSVLL